VEGNAALVRGDLAAIDAVRKTTEKYPDDPEAWFLLGEFYVHAGPALLASPEETRRVVAKAVELDPNFGPYYIHLIEYAIMAGDTAAANQLLRRYAEISSVGYESYLILANHLFLGDSVAQAEARAALDTVSDATLFRIYGNFNFKSGRPAALVPVLDEADDRGLPTGGTQGIVLWAAGKIESRTEWLRSATRSAGERMMLPYENARFTGVDVPVETMDAETCGDFKTALVHCFIEVAAFKIESGDAAGGKAVATGFRNAAAEQMAEGDTARAEFRVRIADAIDAYSLAAGGPLPAIRALEKLQGKRDDATDFWMRVWLARLNEEAGRDRQALPYYESLWDTPIRPWADFRLGQAHERLGEPAEAIEAYRSFLQNWEEADPDLPWLGEARAALDRLVTKQG
jgi:tetratricopeptide (TPR) repeat protein